MIIGYTTGVYDLFHIGHLNIIKRAKENCDYLIVGVTTNQEAERIKNTKPLVPFEERIEIVRALKYVDNAVPEVNSDKIAAWEQLKFNRIFKGSDWKGTPKWKEYEEFFKTVNVEVMYFPYTEGTSSTKLREYITEYSCEKDRDHK